jgi:hypothetical protein
MLRRTLVTPESRKPKIMALGLLDHAAPEKTPGRKQGHTKTVADDLNPIRCDRLTITTVLAPFNRPA